MKSLRLPLLSVAVCFLLTSFTPVAARSTSALARRTDDLPADTLKQLARARIATAKYHDIAQAEADGYADIDLYLPGEGFHYVNFSLIDANFDPEHPEVLLFAPVPGESRLELVGVEYLVPLALSPGAPTGFAGNGDEWREDSEGFGLWEVNAWIWLHNPEGVFAHDNPRVP